MRVHSDLPTESSGYVTATSSVNTMVQKTSSARTGRLATTSYPSTEFLSTEVTRGASKLRICSVFVVMFTVAVLIGVATLFPYMLASTSINWKYGRAAVTTTEYSMGTLRDLGHRAKAYESGSTGNDLKDRASNTQAPGLSSASMENIVMDAGVAECARSLCLPEDMLGMIDNVRTALSQVMLFVKNCTSSEDRLASQKDALLDVLSMIDMEAFPYLANERISSPRLDETLAAALRFHDVTPFFRVRVVENTRGFGNIAFLSRASGDSDSPVSHLAMHVDNLLTSWWKLRDLLPVLYSQPDRDIEAMLNIFRESARISAHRATGPPAVIRLKDLPASNNWDWQRVFNTIFGNSSTFTDYSQVLVDGVDYFRDMAQLIDQYHVRHVLNYLGLCVASQYRLFLSDRYSGDGSLPDVSYSDGATPRREQLCLRHAERICPIGVEALLLQAFATGSFTRKELVDELNWWVPMFKVTVSEVIARMTWLNMKQMLQLQDMIFSMKMDIAFWDASRKLSEDLSTVECGYDPTLYKKHPLLHYTDAFQLRLDRYYRSLSSSTAASRTPRPSTFGYKIVYREKYNSLFIPMSYFGQVLRSAPRLRKFYVVKLFPDLLRSVMRAILANTSNANKDTRFAKIKECVASTYKSYALPSFYQTVLKEPAGYLKELLADHLAVEPYMKLFTNISRSRDFLSGFRPYNGYHMGLIFLAESDCRPYSPSYITQPSIRLSPMSRTNGALSRWLPFASQFQCSRGSPMRKDSCPWYQRGNTPRPRSARITYI